MSAVFVWQLVHWIAFTVTSPECGAWQVMHAVLSAWVTLIPEWQLAHEVAAAPGSWGVWQLVQIACAGTLAARSVSLAP